MQKNTQLERNWLQSLEIDDDNTPKDMYGNILSRCVSDLNSCFQLIFAYLRGCHMAHDVYPTCIPRIFGSGLTMF